MTATEAHAPDPWIVRTVGWRARRRPQPLLGTSLAGMGGLLLSLGIVVLGAKQAADNDGVGWPGAVLSVVLLAAGLAVLRYTPNPVRSAGTTMAVVAVPAFWVFVLLVKENSTPGDGDTVALLGAISLGVLYLVGPARGRAVLLAVALVLLWSFVAGKTGNSGTIGTFRSESSRFAQDSSTYYSPVAPSYLGPALVSLVFGAGFLGALVGLDRKRLSGVATAFVVPGLLATTTGVVLLGQEWGVVFGTLFGLAVGVGVALIGSRSQRRATAWSGAVGALVAVVTLVAYFTRNESGPEAFAAACIAAGIALTAAALLLQMAFAEPDEDDAGTVPPAGPPLLDPPAPPPPAPSTPAVGP
ncbi:MAG: hypothetical protein U0V73_16495 [Acidimicrobiia bacterium]